jgi:hypothetical protein
MNSTLITLKQTFTAIALSAMAMAAIAKDNRAPAAPPSLIVPEGNKVHFHANAIGVQIYTWSGAAWVFKAPEAILFDNDGNSVGIHFAGPTWQTSSGSFVLGTRIAGATMDATAIPWLLLRGATSGGPGVLEGTTYIQRVNTVAGLAPATPGVNVGDEVRVPYAAEYFFYREEN